MPGPEQRPVVVGSDGGGTDSAALQWAARHAQQTGSPLRVVHASEPEVLAARAADTGPAAVAALLEAEEQLRERVRTVVAELGEQLGIATEVVLERDSPLRALLAQQDDARVIVVGTGRKGALEEFVLGTTSIGVAAHATCPVVVINPDVEIASLDRGRIGVAVDGSADSILGARTAVEYAAAIGSSVVAVNTWFLEMKDGYVITEPDSPQWAELVAEREAMVNEALADVRAAHPDVPVEVDIRRGPVVSVLREFSENVDLLVMGSRGRGAFTGRLLGSVSQRLLRASVCPVLVVTRAVEHTAD